MRQKKTKIIFPWKTPKEWVKQNKSFLFFFLALNLRNFSNLSNKWFEINGFKLLFLNSSKVSLFILLNGIRGQFNH